jgi:Ca2+-binding EF-hand superfamily protein
LQIKCKDKVAKLTNQCNSKPEQLSGFYFSFQEIIMTFKIKHMAIITGVLLSTAAFSAPVFSADTMLSTGGYSREMHKMDMMKMIDANGDHMVSQDEYTKYYENLFNELNKDADDSLDAKEWVGAKGEQKVSIATGGYSRELRSMKMMEMMDTDKDHKVTKEEFLKYHQTLFDAMDKKGTKMIDPQEWLATLGK